MARACGHVEHAREFREQFKEVFQSVDSWLDDHSEKVHRAYLSFKPNGIDLTIVQRSEEFDRKFDQAVADFDVQIAKNKDFSLIRLDLLSLPFCPEESTTSFVRPLGTMRRQFG